MFDDPGKTLKGLEQELKSIAPEPGEEPQEPDWDMERQVYFDEDYRADRRRPRKKEPSKKSGCGQLLLALVELLAIAGVLGWLLWRR